MVALFQPLQSSTKSADEAIRRTVYQLCEVNERVTLEAVGKDPMLLESKCCHCDCTVAVSLPKMAVMLMKCLHLTWFGNTIHVPTEIYVE